MHILLIGSGGREHAFAAQLVKSSHCSHLFIMPGNAGTASLGTNVAINPLDFTAVGEFCLLNKIELLVVGPEEPLVKGLRDHFRANHDLRSILFVGPDAAGATLEGSKDWSKAFMKRHEIPTAAYQTFSANQLEAGLAYLDQHELPVVLKADGLAAGKGVLICLNREEAKTELTAMLTEGKFGVAGNQVVVEAFLTGIECSVFALCDGTNYVLLPEAKDYKRIGEGDTGLNTGGMGAISPVPFADATFMQKVKERIVEPTIQGLIQEGIHYVGFVFFGLINVKGEPLVIEYNCRMGDPETEVVLPRIQNDFVELMIAAAQGKLNEIQLQVDPRVAATVMLVSGGYPGHYEKGKVITGLDDVQGSEIFHAGTTVKDAQVVTAGGRVIALTTLAENLHKAVAQSIANANKINFEGKYFRTDIGFEFKA